MLADPLYPDQKTRKVRPVLIISKQTFHDNTNFVVCVGITTNPVKSQYLIPIDDNDYVSTRLKEKSQIMCHRLTMLRVDKIGKKLAEIKLDLYNQVITKIKNDII